MRRWFNLLAPVASAIVLLAAFPPINLRFLVIVGLIPMFLLLRHRHGKKAFGTGYLFGLVYMFGQLHFIQVLVERWTKNVGLSFVPWVLAGLAGALYFGLAAWAISRCWQRGWVWMIPVVWMAVEAFRSYIPVFAFPWGLLATPLYPYPALIQSASLGSIFLVSGWVAAINLMLCFLYVKKQGRHLATVMGMSLALLAFSLIRYNLPAMAERKTVTVGQPGVDLAFAPQVEADRAIFEATKQLYADAREGDSSLLVLPEGVAGLSGQLPPITPFVLEQSPPILFGGKRGTGPHYQTAFAWDGVWKYADKTRLVIFGEFVPGRDFIPFLTAFNLPGGDLQASDRVTALAVGELYVGPVICFEALFPDIAYRQALNGSQVLAVMSVDDWYRDTGAPEQLKAASIWRAVETGLPVIRSASLGYSLATDGRGRILGEIPFGATEGLNVALPIPHDRRPNVLLPILPVMSLLGLAAVIFWPVRRKAQAVD